MNLHHVLKSCFLVLCPCHDTWPPLKCYFLNYFRSYLSRDVMIHTQSLLRSHRLSFYAMILFVCMEGHFCSIPPSVGDVDLVSECETGVLCLEKLFP